MNYSDNPQDWFSTSLPLDKEMRFSHGNGCCKKGESPDRRGRFYVVRKADGWYYYCHNCGIKGFKKATTRERLNAMALQNQIDGIQSDIELQEKGVVDLTRDIFSVKTSLDAMRWLNKYNLTDSEIAQICIRVKRNRLGLIIYDEESNIQGIQWRNLKQDKYPKYITEYVDDYKGGCWFNCNQKLLVIVEDIISACKIARNKGITTAALLGSPTYLSQKMVDKISKYDTIVVWLDSDKIKSALNYQKRLASLYDKKCQVVFKPKDPKDYDDSFIREELERACSLNLYL